MDRHLIPAILSLTGMVVVVLIAIYWNEARKEVIFLCGNFTQGVSEASVRKQLDTGNLSRYRTKENPSGSRIEVESFLNFVAPKCTIEIDSKGEVLVASFE